ncbi:MAG: hypothetical protein KDD41_03675 [Flavobacteriales bacterium]|nr:hypothetical protein [Flavobacteriales bacterium]
MSGVSISIEELLLFEGVMAGIGSMFVIIGKNFLSHKEKLVIVRNVESFWSWLNSQKSGVFVKNLRSFRVQIWITLVAQFIFCFLPFILIFISYEDGDRENLLMYATAFLGAISFSWVIIPKVIRWVIKPENNIHLMLRSLLITGITLLFVFMMSILLMLMFFIDNEVVYNFYSNMFFIVFGGFSSIGNPFLIQTAFIVVWLVIIWLMIISFKILKTFLLRLSFGEKGYVAAFGYFIILVGTFISIYKYWQLYK